MNNKIKESIRVFCIAVIVSILTLAALALVITGGKLLMLLFGEL